MKQIVTAVMAALMTLTAGARDMGDLLASEPGRVFATLTTTARQDMVYYHEAGMTRDVDTEADGTARLTALTDVFAAVTLGNAASIQLRMMTHRGDTVIAVIETVHMPVADSRLTFYDAAWRPLETKRHIKPLPTLDALMGRGVPRADRDSVRRTIAFPVMTMAFEGDNHDTLVVTPRLEEFHSADAPLAALMHRTLRPLRYRLNALKFTN